MYDYACLTIYIYILNLILKQEQLKDKMIKSINGETLEIHFCSSTDCFHLKKAF